MKIIDTKKLESVLRERIRHDLDEGRTSCADIIVNQNGKRLFRITEGWADIYAGERLKEDAMFRLASMTKPVTAVAALAAQADGLIDINAPVSDYIPAFGNMKLARIADAAAKENGCASDASDRCWTVAGPSREPLKMWHLLTHVNGVMTELDLGYMIYEETPRSAFESLKTMTDHCAKMPLNYEPGTQSSYSGYCAFDIMAHIIELKSGMAFKDYVNERILHPLGIEDMTFVPTDEQWERMTKVCIRTEGRTMITTELGRHLYEGFPLSYTCAGAGLAASAESYDRFVRMLLGQGTLDGVCIIPADQFRQMSKIWVHTDLPGMDPVSGWGLGVRVVESDDHWLPKGCFGWSGAYGCHFWVDPENGITAQYLRSNCSYAVHGKGDVKDIFEQDVMSCTEDI